jgi:hypothetical protein
VSLRSEVVAGLSKLQGLGAFGAFVFVNEFYSLPGKSSHGRCSIEKSDDGDRDQNVRPPAKNPSQRKRQSARIGHLTPLSQANCAIVPRFCCDGKVKCFHPRSSDCKGFDCQLAPHLLMKAVRSALAAGVVSQIPSVA